MGTAKQTKQILMEVPLRIRFLNRFPIPCRQRLGVMPSLQGNLGNILNQRQPVRDERRSAGVLLPGESRLAHSSFPQASQVGRAHSTLGAGEGFQDSRQLIADGSPSRLQRFGGTPTQIDVALCQINVLPIEPLDFRDTQSSE